MEGYFTFEEAAAFLGLDVVTIMTYVGRGKNKKWDAITETDPRDGQVKRWVPRSGVEDYAIRRQAHSSKKPPTLAPDYGVTLEDHKHELMSVTSPQRDMYQEMLDTLQSFQQRLIAHHDASRYERDLLTVLSRELMTTSTNFLLAPTTLTVNIDDADIMLHIESMQESLGYIYRALKAWGVEPTFNQLETIELARKGEIEA